MIESDFLRDAPFEWISLIIRYGFVDQDTPHHEPINEAYGDLPLTIELDASGLRNASRAELRLAIEVAVLKALIDVGRRYELPYCAFQVRLTESEAQTL